MADVATKRDTAGGTPATRPARWRNIWVFVAGVMLLAALGGWGVAATTGEPSQPSAEESPFGLLFIISPILVASLLRWFGGDGWRDVGLRFRGDGNWYLLSVLLFPLLSILALGVGSVAGSVSFSGDAAELILSGVAAALVVRMVFAAFEELGWRGYLEPRLEALGMPAARRHLLVGVVWSVWHVPYVLAFDTLSSLSTGVYLPLFLLSVFPMAVIYGVVRSQTGSVWPAVIMHGVANAVAFPLLTSGAVDVENELLFAARPEGLVILAAICVVAAVLWRRYITPLR